MGVYGATRWLGAHAPIQRSLRYKRNDQLWFTFFHEAGHILLHGKKDVFTEAQHAAEAKRKLQRMLLPETA